MDKENTKDYKQQKKAAKAQRKEEARQQKQQLKEEKKLNKQRKRGKKGESPEQKPNFMLRNSGDGLEPLTLSDDETWEKQARKISSGTTSSGKLGLPKLFKKAKEVEQGKDSVNGVRTSDAAGYGRSTSKAGSSSVEPDQVATKSPFANIDIDVDSDADNISDAEDEGDNEEPKTYLFHADDSGRRYYISALTKMTQWKKPERGMIWQRVFDASKGLSYFVNLNTKTATWDMPQELYPLLGKANDQATPTAQLQPAAKPSPKSLSQRELPSPRAQQKPGERQPVPSVENGDTELDEKFEPPPRSGHQTPTSTDEDEDDDDEGVVYEDDDVMYEEANLSDDDTIEWDH